MASEAEIQKGIVRFLRNIGGAVWVTSQGYRKDPGGTRMTPGLPDLVVMFGWDWRTTVKERPGVSEVYARPVAHWTFAEVKTSRGRLSPAQIVFRDHAVRAGVPWELWRSVSDAVAWAKRTGIVE